MNVITEVIDKFFPGKMPVNSRSEAKRRLKLVIAHDRADLNPEIIESLRQEIIAVVARYVEIDLEEMEFSLENDQRMTYLTANLPIRRVKIPPNLANIE
ncbi:cell division topological specificity factor MinE [Gloeocapsa sp. PCC 73106]|uniref:cell division topological specificity factor MinE n=1 Tax=Gloeocapsa sp. PCC 73106 TaxID=102232 RepID=UPI0002AD07A0|nr:cell division topological specificity factor MinE [Gloeocapsa sp. PCC 73106]ELR97105.1 cell division topological specificity factor MinE [Gloeocapsa sp. PCC 73106]